MESFFVSFFDYNFSQSMQVLTGMETKTPFDSLHFILRYYSKSIGMPEILKVESRLLLRKVSLAPIARRHSNDTSMSSLFLSSMRH